MIDIQFIDGAKVSPDGEAWRYRILDTFLCSNRKLESLHGFAEPGSCESGVMAWREIGAPVKTSESAVVVHDHQVKLRCRRGVDGLQLELDDQARIFVSPAHGSIVVELSLGELTPFCEQLVLGPGLVFLATHEQIHFLHGSALATPDGVLIFTGPSGSGKSTLAATLAAMVPEWELLADDVVAVDTRDSTAKCLPRFPQPKLSDALQPAAREATLAIAGIFNIEPCSAAEQAALTTTRAVSLRGINLINHVMGSGSGDRVIENNILQAVSSMVDMAPGGSLAYPHSPQGPGGIRAIVHTFLRDQQG